jgi:hypothetical protein
LTPTPSNSPLCASDFPASREPPSMASSSSAPPHPHPHARVSLEEREVHRIYQPWLSAHGSSLNVANHVDSLAQGDLLDQGYQARSSRDKALTAYAQLVALRLNVRRCMISLIDTSNQYILAEATRSVSIANSRAAVDDELWLGSAVLSRPDAICEHCFTSTCTAVDDCGATLTAKGLIISDCSVDERFKDRPYVVSEPGIRFYAGVPIYSRNGYMIGACAVSDEFPRATLKVDELRLMQETAQSVIEHLECEFCFDPHPIRTSADVMQWSVNPAGWITPQFYRRTQVVMPCISMHFLGVLEHTPAFLLHLSTLLRSDMALIASPPSLPPTAAQIYFMNTLKVMLTIFHRGTRPR